jgi:hypothetical protein
MAKLPSVKRLVAEDYPEDVRDLIGRLGFILNGFMDDVTYTVNGNLDYDNLTQKLVTFEITMGANGKPVNAQVNVGKASVRGISVIKVVNKTNASAFPSTCPFISYTPSNTQNVININNITGLTASSKYEISVIVY